MTTEFFQQDMDERTWYSVHGDLAQLIEKALGKGETFIIQQDTTHCVWVSIDRLEYQIPIKGSATVVDAVTNYMEAICQDQHS